MNITDLVLATERLPDRIEDLLPLRFIGEKAVRFYKDKVDLIDKLEMSKEQRDETLLDGQDAGKALLMIEGKIGELYTKTPAAYPATRQKEQLDPGVGSIKGRRRTFEDQGIGRADAWRAKEIHKHPEVVEEVIQEAEKEKDIPTKGAVLRKIASRQEAQRVKGKEEKTRMELEGPALQYYFKLEQVLHILPTYPPRELTEHAHKALKALALIIIKRLEVFLDEQETDSTTSPGARRLSS